MVDIKRFGLFVALIGILTLGVPVSAQEPTPAPAVQGPASDAVTTRPSDVQPDQPAVPITDVPSPAEPDHSTEAAQWALVGTLLLQYLKKSTWFTPLSDATSSRVKSIWGFALTLLTSAGINFSITGSLLDTTGATVTFTGVSLSAFKDLAWQWGAQQGLYNIVVKLPTALMAKAHTETVVKKTLKEM